ncbi:MAG: periplasmic heavy metal sensor [Alphaproteobacteria bacterium]|nr:periplasmic heavy metal sensor [Alphaproteobacteria bacterium]MCB1682064.1 periplasmic heavy metal sensor [Alphaproteobacteria bacterium]MCB9975726.1 periplasmic heavy metal sensor [Rhodospirillales bacterium]
MSRKMKVIFTLSLLVNLLLGGLVLGHHFHRQKWSAQFEEGLSPQGQETVRAAFMEGRKDFWPMVREMKGAKDGLVDAINKPVLDEGAYDTAVENMKGSLLKLMDHRFATMKRIVQNPNLSQEDRVRFANKFVRLVQGFGKSSGKHADGQWREKHGEMLKEYQTDRIKKFMDPSDEGSSLNRPEADSDRAGDEGMLPPPPDTSE